MISRRFTALFVATVAIASACAASKTPAPPKELELGPHRVQVSTPAGWELLDQGAQKRFRKGESSIVLENLGKVDWDGALEKLSNDERRAVKSRRAFLIGDREAVDVETWNRLDHAWPQRFLFVRVDEDVIALHTEQRADEPTAKAFESIRDSLHFAASARR